MIGFTIFSGNQGWRAIIWDRMITSDSWCQRTRVDAATISVDPSYADLLPQLWNAKTGELDLKRLIFETPTLSKHDDDLLYVMSKVNREDDTAWVITVDMKHKAVEAIAPYSTKGRRHISWHCPCTFPKYLDLTPGADVAMHSKRISAADCVLQMLLSRDWFREIDERLKLEMPTYHECVALLDCCPVPSLLLDIQEVVKYAFSNGQGEAAPEAVDLCSRVLEDIEALVRESVRDPSSSSAKFMRSKIGVALGALDSVLDMVPQTLRVLADACHQEGGKTIFDLGEEPEDLKPPDANHGKNKKAVHNTKDKSYELQQGRSDPKNRLRSMQNQVLGCDERAVVPDHRRLERSRRSPPYVMIFLCLVFVAYIWTPIAMRLLGHRPLASH